jgi:hypothetical protein
MELMCFVCIGQELHYLLLVVNTWRVAAFGGGAGLCLAAKIMAFRHVEMDSLFGTSLVTLS